MSPAEVLKLVKERGLKLVDYKSSIFWVVAAHHHADPPAQGRIFSEGFGFDGSSIRGWKAIHESDMIFVPDASTACVDPFFKEPTLSLICDIVDAVTTSPMTAIRAISPRGRGRTSSRSAWVIRVPWSRTRVLHFDEVRFGEGRTTPSTR